MSKNISRRSFLKGAAGVAGATALGVLAGTGSAFAEEAAQAVYTPGTYKSVQTTPYATVEVSCTFSETALTDVSYEVLKTSESDYFTPFANPMKAYCERIVAAGKTEGVDGVTGASFSADAIKAGVDDCKLIGIPRFEDSSIVYRVRFFCQPAKKYGLRPIVNEIILEELTKANVSIPYPQLDVHMNS